MLRAPYVIVGIGFAGCVALAWMAQNLQRHAKVARPAPVTTAAAAFADRLDGPLASQEEHDGVGMRRVLVGRAAPGQDRPALARAIAEHVARCEAGAARVVAVTLRDAAGAEPCTVELPSAPASPR